MTQIEWNSVLLPWRFENVRQLLEQVESQTSIPSDQLNLLCCFFLSYPLAFLQSQISSVQIKHYINIFIGITMAQFVYNIAWLHSLFTSIVTYYILKWLPIRYSSIVAFLFNMEYLAFLHIIRMMNDYNGWKMDCTTSQMIIVIKLTSFAINFYDGKVKTTTEMDENDSLQLSRMKTVWKAMAITEFPSLVEYLGYVFCFTTFFAGPCFEYRIYLDAIRGSRFNFDGKRVAVSLLRPALCKCAIGVFFMVLVALFGSYSNVSAPFHQELSFNIRTIRVVVALFITRCKYYCAWKLAEGATILTGAGFEGFASDGAIEGFDGVNNIDIIGFETAQNIRVLVRSWNRGTQMWLERYVYSRTNTLFLTYLCSAVWHGFYPGYYIFFLSLPLVTTINRRVRRHIRPLFDGNKENSHLIKRVYDCVGVVCTLCTINYLAISFVVLSWEESLRSYQSLYFFGHIAIAFTYLFLAMFPFESKSKEL
uniref:Lysophospholipid acyltransferase putative n=1 Tax=Albugo laibachii Nc14 TaxID=890382 RepID=F0WBZ2_9STRA|nr:lysophospholipid acyltransferase putative [Albugo laibachii Nc14]|eukprot:CCA18673.1 lysophospholipid acyltransferase putative [Albugo laibachii Nc14]